MKTISRIILAAAIAITLSIISFLWWPGEMTADDQTNDNLFI
jgi:hypothetical protein